MKQSPVVHFEMPAKDNARVAKFYTEAFGWQMNQLGPEMGNYLLAGTTPVDENQMALNPGAINGGFFEWKDEAGFSAPHIVIQVENLDESIEAVKKSGGEVIGEKMDIPGIGTYASFRDTEGNNVGILQPPKA
ncbi:MAG TPA: VOC family protein [Candidatus Levybacteria bacterium]|jgi:predicted enzyme related to lactoylglutathione lyase|nr:VOC family protein [Candidatus Levybacteria bacterium]